LAGGLGVAARLPQAIRSAALSSHILGIGAEACLTGFPYYIAEHLQSGRLAAGLADWLRLDSYYRPTATRIQRLKLLRSHGIAPLVHVPPWARRSGAELPLHQRWLALFREAREAADSERRCFGPARGVQVEQLRRYSLITGLETHEQLNEHYGVETQMPFLHRGVMDFGLRLSLRELACGLHEKELLRRTAALALERDPPWPRRKVNAQWGPAMLRDGLLALGSPTRWALVRQDVLDEQGVSRAYAAMRAGRAPSGHWLRVAVFERFLRDFSA
jgi:asparagine synthetase B (glutamine-hydrolysing)